MKKVNIPLIIGTIIIIALLIVSVYPEYFSSVDPYCMQRISYENNSIVVPPIPPSKDYPWGTDHIGRDLKSLIVYGCQCTMAMALSVAIGRLLIAIPIAILAGYRNKLAKGIIKLFNVLFGAMPFVFAVCVIVDKRIILDIFDSRVGAIVFLLTVLGWSKLAYLLSDKVSEILNQDFIEGEIALGKSKWEIAIQNIIPHIIPSLIILFFLEIAMVLLVLVQVGIFSTIFNIVLHFDNNEGLRLLYTFDWASLLLGSDYFLLTKQLWMIIYPAAAFAISIIGFNLFGEGLKIEFEKRNSRVISYIRRIPLTLSPKRFIHEIKNFRAYKATVYKKCIAISLVLLLVFFPHGMSKYKFDNINAFNTIGELSSDKYQGRMAGTGNDIKAAEYIADKLKEYGVQQFEGAYLHEYDINRVDNLKTSSMTIIDENNNAKELIYRKDYSIENSYSISGTFKTYYLSPKVINEINSNRIETINEIKAIDDLIFVADARFAAGYRGYYNLINYCAKQFNTKAIIFLDNLVESNNYQKSVNKNRAIEFPTIIVPYSLEKEIINTKIKLDIKVETYENVKGVNVAGFIEGSDPELKNEYIVVGSSYDYVGYDENIKYPGAMCVGGTSIELEIAKVMMENDIKPRRSIIFVFWDGTLSDYRGSFYFAPKYFGDKNNRYFYIDLKQFINQKSKKIMLDISNIFPTDAFSQGNIKILKNNIKKHNVKLVYGQIQSKITEDFKRGNKSIVIIDSIGTEEIDYTPKDDITVIDKKKLGKVGQMLLDSVIEMTMGE